MTPLIQSFKRIWLCTLRRMRPFVASRIDPYLTPHRIELLRKVFAHLDVAIDGERNPKGGVLQATIVADFAVDKSSISRMLSKMERDGFIYRTQWRKHIMYKVVHLTELGFEIMEIVRTLRFDEQAPDAEIFEAFLANTEAGNREEVTFDVGPAANETPSETPTAALPKAALPSIEVIDQPNTDGTDPPTEGATEEEVERHLTNEIAPSPPKLDAIVTCDENIAPPSAWSHVEQRSSSFQSEPDRSGGGARVRKPVKREALEALFRQCNAIRIGLGDNAMHLHPWRIQDSAERFYDAELGIFYWRDCRLREDNVDDRILDELPDEYIAVVGPFRPDNDVPNPDEKWRRPDVA